MTSVTVRELGKHRAAEGKYLIAEDNPTSGPEVPSYEVSPSGSRRQHRVVRPFVLHERIQPRLPAGAVGIAKRLTLRVGDFSTLNDTLVPGVSLPRRWVPLFTPDDCVDRRVVGKVLLDQRNNRAPGFYPVLSIT